MRFVYYDKTHWLDCLDLLQRNPHERAKLTFVSFDFRSKLSGFVAFWIRHIMEFGTDIYEWYEYVGCAAERLSQQLLEETLTMKVRWLRQWAYEMSGTQKEEGWGKR